MLLIVSNRRDLAADYVVARILERRYPYFRINAEDLSEADYHLQLSNSAPNLVVTILGRTLHLRDVSSVWYRRQLFPNVNDVIAECDRPFAEGELVHLIEGALPRLGCRWVDDPDRVRFAERKLQQLKVATANGIPIPETIISTNPDTLCEFVRSHERGVVCKPIFRGLHSHGKQIRAAYTRLATADEFENLKEGQVFPTLLQQLIPKGSDLRVTVIGSHIFGVEISTHDRVLDWRLPDVRPCNRRIEVPTQVASACRLMLDRLGLTCGAFDFAISPEGDYFFLEVNPVGEWAWLDIELGLGIRDALIDFLYLES